MIVLNEKAVKRALDRRDWTIADLAKKLKVTSTTVNHYFMRARKGKRIYASTLKRLATALNVVPSRLRVRSAALFVKQINNLAEQTKAVDIKEISQNLTRYGKIKELIKQTQSAIDIYVTMPTDTEYDRVWAAASEHAHRQFLGYLNNLLEEK